jgi:hypothetical protein
VGGGLGFGGTSVVIVNVNSLETVSPFELLAFNKKVVVCATFGIVNVPPLVVTS